MLRTGIYLLVILSIVVGAAVVTDAVVVTDRERMDEFIECITALKKLLFKSRFS